MENFDLHILGCGSAQSTLRHHQTSQVLDIHRKLFMIDCGEGTLQQLRKTHLGFPRLNHVFISHLHGDHCFGLMGLISTFSLLGRTQSLHLYAPKELEALMSPLLEFFCAGMQFEVVFHAFDTKKSARIYDDRTLTVDTIPLKHRMPCCGFIFREKAPLPHIRRDMIDYLQIPHYEINRIKEGGSWTKEDGTVVPHEQLVTPPSYAPRSYAYLSDTVFMPERAPMIKNVTTLFHEATFASTEAARAKQTQHSTAAQAAQMAELAACKQLVIGHFSSRYEDENILLEESKKIFPNTILAYEGMKLEIM